MPTWSVEYSQLRKELASALANRANAISRKEYYFFDRAVKEIIAEMHEKAPAGLLA